MGLWRWARNRAAYRSPGSVFAGSNWRSLESVKYRSRSRHPRSASFAATVAFWEWIGSWQIFYRRRSSEFAVADFRESAHVVRDRGGGPLSGPVAILGSQQLTLDTGLPETLSAPDLLARWFCLEVSEIDRSLSVTRGTNGAPIRTFGPSENVSAEAG